MTKKSDALAEHRTRLAEKRTELAIRRTAMSDVRTGGNLILFGIAFVGLSKNRWDFLFTSGIIAICIGTLLLSNAFWTWIQSKREFKVMKGLIRKLIKLDKPIKIFSSKGKR